jgi:predicted RND superfamily exporter protein
LAETTGRETIRERILARVAALACRRAVSVLVAAALLTVFSVAVILHAGRGLISTDLADVLPTDSPQASLYVEAAEHVAADVLLVALEADDPADIQAAKPFVERLARRLERLEALVRSVEYRPAEKLREFARRIAEERGYLFLDETDRELLRRKLASEAIGERMAENRRRLESVGLSQFRRGLEVRDPLGLLEVLRRRRAEAGGGEFRPKEGEDFLVSPDGMLMLVVVQAAGAVKDLAFDQALMTAVERAEEETWAELLSEDRALWGPLRERVRVGHTGGYAIAVDQNETLTEDITGSFGVSLLGVLLLFALVFRRLGALVYIGLPLVASVVWTVAVARLVFGHISVMSGGFAAILVGLSIDYAIHVYNRYVAERSRGLGLEPAIEGAIVHAGSGIFFGAVTTAVAFFGIMWTSFTGLAEFGFLAGLGVFFGMGAMLLVQPAMLVARSRLRAESPKVSRVVGFWLPSLARAVGRAPRAIFIVPALAAVAAVVFVDARMDVYFFDSDFRNLRAESPVFDLTERIARRFGTNLAKVMVLSRGGTPAEALARADAVRERAEEIMEGTVVARGEGRVGPGDGFPAAIRVEGCRARLRRAEIALPPGSPRVVLGRRHGPRMGADGALHLAPGAVVTTRQDGSRLVTYEFSSETELDDWTVEGPHRFFGGIDLDPGSTARWKRGTTEATFSVRFLGEAEAVALGGEGGAGVRAEAASVEASPGRPWPPARGDQVRLTLELDEDGRPVFVAGRGTILSVDSLARFVPPEARQRASAKFVASIDVARIEADMEGSARANRLHPRLFEALPDGETPFIERLRGLVERAKEPEFLTIEELEGREAGALVGTYHYESEAAPPGQRHTVATKLVPEKGELPREWFERVEAGLGEGAKLTAGRLASLEVRDIVHDDLSWITLFVYVGVLVVLLWSFVDARWAVGIGAGLAAVLLVTKLLSVPDWIPLVGSAAGLLAWGRSRWSMAALLPIAMGLAFLVATLLVVGHRLNFINVLIFPVIIGIGIDNGIHVIHRFRQSGRVRDIITETGRALVMTSLTTMVGFGSLMVSRYRGLASLGFVATLGMFFCLFSSLVVLPALLAAIAPRTEAAGAAESSEEAKGGGS